MRRDLTRRAMHLGGVEDLPILVWAKSQFTSLLLSPSFAQEQNKVALTNSACMQSFIQIVEGPLHTVSRSQQ